MGWLIRRDVDAGFDGNANGQKSSWSGGQLVMCTLGAWGDGAAVLNRYILRPIVHRLPFYLTATMLLTFPPQSPDDTKPFMLRLP